MFLVALVDGFVVVSLTGRDLGFVMYRSGIRVCDARSGM